MTIDTDTIKSQIKETKKLLDNQARKIQSEFSKKLEFHYNEIKNQLKQIDVEQETMVDVFVLATKSFTTLRDQFNDHLEHLSKNQEVLISNQKIFEKRLKDFDTMMAFAWKSEEFGIDTKSDVVKFTATEKLQYIKDYTIELDQEILESGRRIEKLKLIKTKKEDDKQLSFDFDKEDKDGKK